MQSCQIVVGSGQTLNQFEKIAERMHLSDPRLLPSGTFCCQIAKPLLCQLRYGGTGISISQTMAYASKRRTFVFGEMHHAAGLKANLPGKSV